MRETLRKARRSLGAAAMVLALLAAGCSGARKERMPPPPPEPEKAVADERSLAAMIPPAVPIPEEPAPVRKEPPAGGSAPVLAEPPPPGPTSGIRDEEKPASPAPAPEPPPEERKPAPESPVPAVVALPSAPPAPRSSGKGTSARKPKAPSAPGPEAPVRGEDVSAPGSGTPAREEAPSGPAWARRSEVLAYRVDFIGITMGYARFRYQGRVSIGGQVAYHLKVRAWTSGVLSYIYPINETIDYYLDAETLAPIRQEFTGREKDKDDVALYDQDTGKIVYRYRQSGEIRKEVETVPRIYDPVSAAYYFRWRDVGGDEKARNVYAGRKVWQISARLLGTERLRTAHGEIDTLVVQPVIRRDGKIENKGDLRMWLSRDETHIPVRLYAKFHKIKDWTLVGELMPDQGGG